MKYKHFLTFLFAACLTPLIGQQIVSGVVTDAQSGETLIGVNITVEGTTTGTTTDIDGLYQIETATDAVLRFSYTGYEDYTVTVAGQSTIDVAMSSGVELDEVVVVALGMKREKKAATFAVTEIKGSSFQEAREVNLANALSGKIAGVNVSNISSGPSGSSRVIIRGNVSLDGNNQPLYVVDGVPINNSTFGQAGKWSGTDEGDGMSSINPDDIESISVLKGGSAAALYGSRASNGVIIITTKSGSRQAGLGIEYSSNFVADTYIDRYDLQQQYGQGRRGERPSSQADAFDIGSNAWGSAFDGSPYVQFDGQTVPWSYAGDNAKRFYNTGSTWTNSLGFSGGSDKQNIRVNFSALNNKGIIPNSAFDRYNASLAYNGKYGDKVTLTSKILYSNEVTDNRAQVSDSPGSAVQGLIRLPPNINVNDIKGDPNKPGAIQEGFIPVDGKETGAENQISDDRWNTNPWWAAYQVENDDTRDRVITSNSVRFDVTDFLYVQGRVGMDYYTRRERDLTPYGQGDRREGRLTEREHRFREINLEALVGFNKNFGDFSVDAFVGGNRMRTSNEQFRLRGNNLNIPFFHTFANAQNQEVSLTSSDEGINSIFGSANIGYKGMVYLNVTAREDVFSTLDPNNNSILYPSVGASFIFSELMNTNTGFLTFGKIRASWAEVGGDTDPYKLALTYDLGNGHNGQPTGSIAQSSIPNSLLRPLTSSEFEVGLDLRFLNNRLGIDLAYYVQNTTDDILNATISGSSGFNSTTINVGELENRGIELLITGNPIRKENFSWDVSLNLAHNDSEVIALSEGINEIQIGAEVRTGTARIKQIVGQPYGTISGFTQRMFNGQPVFDPVSGQPIRSTEESALGNGVYKFTGGLNNSLTYKNLYMDFLIDFKAGASIYSGSNARFVDWGYHKLTTEAGSGLGWVSTGRDNLTVTGVDTEGNPVNLTLDETQTPDFWGAYSGRLAAPFIRDASYIKFRQFSLGYRIPKRILGNSPIKSATISLVGRNLFLIKSSTENIDPEANYNNTNAQGLEYFGVPQTRSYGVNLKVKF